MIFSPGSPGIASSPVTRAARLFGRLRGTAREPGAERSTSGWKALPDVKGEHCMSSQRCGASASLSRSARTRRDLPMPGSPETSTDLAAAVLHLFPAIEQVPQLAVAAHHGPAASAAMALRTPALRSTSCSSTGASTPLSCVSPRLFVTKTPRHSESVASLTTTLPGFATPSIRAARFDVGPRASASSPTPLGSTTTSPVWMPMRASIRRASGRSPSTRWISSPARIARPASSSCACG